MTVDRHLESQTDGAAPRFRETLAGLDQRSLAASEAWLEATRWPWVEAAAWIAGADATLMQTLCGWRYKLDQEVGESDSGVWLIAAAHIRKHELDESETLLRQRLRNGALVAQRPDGSTATVSDWEPPKDNLSHLFVSEIPDVPQVYLSAKDLRRIWPEVEAQVSEIVPPKQTRPKPKWYPMLRDEFIKAHRRQEEWAKRHPDKLPPNFPTAANFRRRLVDRGVPPANIARPLSGIISSR